jgi:hypothetical protein
MRKRRTVTLDDDVIYGVKRVSESRRRSFRETMNDLLRSALTKEDENRPVRAVRTKPFDMGYEPPEL